MPAIGVAFAVVCIPLAWTLNIWQDEAYTIYTTSQGVREAFIRAITFEAQAPLYFVLLDLWRHMNASVLFGRIFSIVCALATLPLAGGLASRLTPAIHRTLVCAIVAFNPFFIWAALEMRVYALAIFLSTAVLYSFMRGFVDEVSPLRRWWRAAFVLSAIAAMFTQYLTGTVLIGALAALTASSKRAALQAFFLSLAAILAGIVPLAWIIPRQLGSYSQSSSDSSAGPLAVIIAAMSDFVLPHGWIGTWAHAPVLNGIYSAVVVSLMCGIVIGSVDGARVRIGVALAGGAGLALAAILAVTGEHIGLRHVAVLLVPAILATLSLIGAIADHRLRTLTLGVFLFAYAAFATLSLARQYAGFVKPGDWRNVGEYVTAQAHSGDAVLVFDQETVLPFGFYYRGTAAVTPIPRTLEFDRFDPAEFRFRNEADVARSFSAIRAGGKKVWLVSMPRCVDHAAFYGCGYLDRYVARFYDRVSQRNFHGTIVRELVVRTAPVATIPPAAAPLPKRTSRAGIVLWTILMVLCLCGAIVYRIRGPAAFAVFIRRGQEQESTALRRTAIAVCATIVALCAWETVQPQRSVLAHVGLDFRAFYCSGAVSAAGRNPYVVEPLRSCEHRVQPQTGWDDDLVIPSPLPPYDMAALAALAQMPYGPAKFVWYAILIVSLGATVFTLSRLTGFPSLFVLTALGVSDGLFSWLYGQLPGVVVASLSVSGYLLSRGRERAAALVAAISLIEPHLGLPACLALFLWIPRTRAVLSLVAAVLGIVSVASVGWHGTIAYFTTVLPGQAASELAAIDQFSLSHALFIAGVPANVALLLGTASYIVMVIVGLFAARHAYRALALPALIVTLPCAAALLGGSYVHEIQFAAALPAALIVAARAVRWRLAGYAALAFLVFPWQAYATQGHSLVPILPIAAIVWLAALFPEGRRTRVQMASAFGGFGMTIILIAFFRALPPASLSADHAIDVKAAQPELLASVNWEAHLKSTPDLSVPSPRKELEKFPAYVAIVLLLGTAAVQRRERSNAGDLRPAPALQRSL